MAQTPLILNLLASSVSAARRAGHIIRDVMKSGQLGIVAKDGKKDLQTAADRSAQMCIVASLEKMYPGVSIIGEEGDTKSLGQVPSNWIVTEKDSEVLSHSCPEQWKNISPDNVVIWVDPLDGTSEFTEELLEHVTVLIGIAVEGKPIAGVIHQPYYNYKNVQDTTGRTIWGLDGHGVAGFVPAEPPLGKFIIAMTRSHSNELVEKMLETLNPDEVLRVGGAGYKVLVLLEGKAHAYVHPSIGTKKWDTCAVEAVLTALGGKLTGVDGKNYSYKKGVQYSNSQGIVATSKGVDHQSILSKIPQEIKDKLI